MAFCIKCGKQNPDANKFCIACGTALKAESIMPGAAVKQPDTGYFKEFDTNQKSKNRTWVIVAIVSVIVMGTGAYFVFFNKKKKEDAAKESGSQVSDKKNTETSPGIDQPSSSSENAASYTDVDGKLVFRSDCYVIITGSFAEENYARGYVSNMKNQGYSNVGYLWIPDYPSLSGKQFYASFIGPYQSYTECENNLRTLKVNSRFWYGKKVSYSSEQIEIRIK